jgi:tetratricopeptide (TPR) repeat protein
MSRRAIVSSALAIVAIMVAGAAILWWQQHQRAGVIAPFLQAEPNLAAFPDDVRGKFVAARRRAQGGSRPALAELSTLYHANGFLVEAMQCYAALEHLPPEEPKWLHRHATIAAGFGDFEPAALRWRRVIVLAPDYIPARLRLGELLLKANRVDEAAAVFRGTLEKQPDNPHAALGLARIDIDAGRWAEARERLEKIVAQTDYALGYDLIVTTYEKLGRSAEAENVRRRAKASGAYRDLSDPWMAEILDACFDPYQLALAAGAAERAGEFATSVRLLERALSLSENVTVRFQLASLYSRRGDTRNARAQLERCTKVSPDFADAWAHLSALLEQSGDRVAAERTLAEGLRHCPDSPGLHLMHARQLRRNGRTEAALGAYQRSIQLRSNEADAYVEAATLLFQVERANEALRYLQQALVVEPDHPTALTVLALAAISAGDEPVARQWLVRVREQPRVAPAQAQQLYAAYREQFRREFR